MTKITHCKIFKATLKKSEIPLLSKQTSYKSNESVAIGKQEKDNIGLFQ